MSDAPNHQVNGTLISPGKTVISSLGESSANSYTAKKVEEKEQHKPKPNVDLSQYTHIPNPYHWPKAVINLGLAYKGAWLKIAGVKDDPQTHVQKIRAMPVRHDDVFLVAYPKSGTHWVVEMISMLLKGRPEFGDQDKVGSMLEFTDDIASLDTRPSPRFFNSHHYFVHLPQGIVEKKAKIVHVIRNAKDTAVSWFHHLKTNSKDAGDLTFDSFLKGYMLDDYSSYSNQFCFLRQMSKFVSAHPEHPIFHVHYEDLKENPVATLSEIAKFLEVPVKETLCQEIVDACTLSNMKKAEGARKIKSSRVIYRKGLVGDWKNLFTVAQNEIFEDFVRAQEQKGSLNIRPKVF